MDLTLHVAVWAALATAVILLGMYRKAADSRTRAGAAVRIAGARKLQVIDWWGRMLTCVTMIYLLAIGGMFVYGSFARDNIPHFTK